jgi:hypothetical protein
MVKSIPNQKGLDTKAHIFMDIAIDAIDLAIKSFIALTEMR